ncbi:hypothetical protein VPH35_125729 [Triticum aestivum]
MEKPVEGPISRLTHDLIAEILSRVPYKSLCIHKCVCPAWRDLIADPAHRKKVVQTLAGFFYHITGEATPVKYADLSAFPWSSVPKTYPLLPQPPDKMGNFFSLEGSCNGLFLARIRAATPAGTVRYMVSNPATSEYTVLPDSGSAGNICRAYLGFNSGVSTQEFHVFEFVLDWPDWTMTGVNIYSSKTGAWVAMDPQWDIQVRLCWREPRVFRKGCLHLLIRQFGLAILPISVDPFSSGFIGKSAGQLVYIDSGGIEGHGSNAFSTILVYVLGVEIYQWDVTHLDDKCTRWKLLHKLSNVAPKKIFRLGFDLEVIAVHPHANIIFFMAHRKNELVAYDLDHHESAIVYHIEPNYQKSMAFFSHVPLLPPPPPPLPLDGGIRMATPN